MATDVAPLRAPDLDGQVRAPIGKLLRPRSIVVIGASDQRSTAGNAVLKNLVDSRYDGQVHVVHPTADDIEGFTPVRAVSELPDAVDVAVVSVPATSAVGVLHELEAAGCRAAIVPAVGLDAQARADVQALAERGFVVCGPNTMGVMNVVDDIPMSIGHGVLSRVRSGSSALITQSGGACLAVVRATEAAGFSYLIPSGNEWGTTAADYLRWLALDESTDSAGLILESVNDVESFREAVRVFRRNGKRLVALHIGRSPKGAAAATAHSASLVGRVDAYRAFFADLDVPLVADYDEMAGILDTFAYDALPLPRGGRVAALTVSGGLAALTADIAHDKAIELVDLAPETRRALTTLLPGTDPLNPFDTGGGATYTPELFAAAVEALADDPAVDSVMAVLDAQISMPEAELEYEEEDFTAVAAAVETVTGKPVIIASSSSGSIHPRWKSGRYADIPVVRGIGNAFVTLRALGMNRRPVPDRPPRAVPAGSEALHEQIRGRALSDPGPLPAEMATALLESYGIPTARSGRAVDIDDAVRRAPEIGYPLVAKVVAPGLVHRSDVGGVATGIDGPDALRRALDAMVDRVGAARPDLTIVGFELQRQYQARLEATVGCVTDEVFGPMIVAGTGGVLVEILDDTAAALAPFDDERALALVRSTRFATVAGGYRNLVEPTDLEPLARVISAFSRLAHDYADVIREVDLNPVLIEEGTGAPHVVDALVVVGR